MKKIILILVNLSLIGACFAQSKVCITLTNENREHDVTLNTEGGSRPFIVPRFQTFILPEPEMGWACPNDNDCSIFIRDDVTGEITDIRHFPNGAKITYFAKDQFELDPHANNICLH